MVIPQWDTSAIVRTVLRAKAPVRGVRGISTFVVTHAATEGPSRAAI